MLRRTRTGCWKGTPATPRFGSTGVLRILTADFWHGSDPPLWARVAPARTETPSGSPRSDWRLGQGSVWRRHPRTRHRDRGGCCPEVYRKRPTSASAGCASAVGFILPTGRLRHRCPRSGEFVLAPSSQASWAPFPPPQHVNKYVEREIINHMKLRHPHIIGLREVSLRERRVRSGLGGVGGMPLTRARAGICSASRGLEGHGGGWGAWQLTAWCQAPPRRCLRSMQPACLPRAGPMHAPLLGSRAAPHTPTCHGQVFLTSNHLVLAMEFAAGGDLFKYVSSRRSLPEPEARWIFQQLIVAIDYCHRMVRGASGKAWCCTGLVHCAKWGCVVGGSWGLEPHPRGRRPPGACSPARGWPVWIQALPCKLMPCRVWPAGTSSWRTRCWTTARGR